MSSLIPSGGASGTGSVTLLAPNTNSTQTITLPDLTGTVITTASSGQVIPSGALPVGSVLQVVQGTTATSVGISTTTFTDTTLTATITPKFSTSKILVMVTQAGVYRSQGATTNGVSLKLLRNGSNITTMGLYIGYTGTAIELIIGTNSINYLDSPATTSATTYKTQFANFTNTSSVFVQNGGETSTITLLEIAQ